MNRQNSKDSSTTLTNKEDTPPSETPLSTSPNSPLSESSNGGGYGNDTISRPSNFSSYADYTSRDVSENIDEEDQPQLSERKDNYKDDDDEGKHVQFNKDKKVDKGNSTESEDDDKRRRKE